MFTGIIQSIGRVVKAERNNKGLRLTVRTALERKVVPGDSIAVSGVCLTVAVKSQERRAKSEDRGSKPPAPSRTLLTFDAVPETVRRSTLGFLKTGDEVNIEAAIRAGEPFGGHFVQGHVDTVGTMVRLVKHGNEYLITVNCASGITGSIIEKGSIALDGISLTVFDVQARSFRVAIIPFTLKHTILGKKKTGDKINIELDIIGKWVKKSVNPSKSRPYSDEGF